MARTTWKPPCTANLTPTSATISLTAPSRSPSSGRNRSPMPATFVTPLSRFDQVEDATDADREQAFANIKAAAEHYDIDVEAETWKDLGKP